MYIIAEYIKPGDLDVKITITMPAKEWKALIEDMPDMYPKWDFKRHVNDILRKLESHVGSWDVRE